MVQPFDNVDLTTLIRNDLVKRIRPTQRRRNRGGYLSYRCSISCAASTKNAPKHLDPRLSTITS